MNSLVVCLWELRIKISMLSVSNAPHAAHRWKIKATSTCTINCTAMFMLAWRHWIVHHQMQIQTAWRLSPSNRKYKMCVFSHSLSLSPRENKKKCLFSHKSSAWKCFYLTCKMPKIMSEKLLSEFVLFFFRLPKEQQSKKGKMNINRELHHKYFLCFCCVRNPVRLANEESKVLIDHSIFLYISLSPSNVTEKMLVLALFRLHWTLMLEIWMEMWVVICLIGICWSCCFRSNLFFETNFPFAVSGFFESSH